MSLLGGILEFLFPTRCLLCRREAPEVMCPECCADVQLVTEPICRICGVPVSRGDICSACIADPPLYTSARGVAIYGGTLRKAVHVLKYGGKRRMAKPLASLLVNAFDREAFMPDFIVPVPLHPARERRRGFNQARLIALHFSQQVGVPVECSVIRKVQPTSPQRTLAREERRINLRGAFSSAAHERVKGMRVLLVDDVMTTGATLSEVAGVLREAGAVEVQGLCVARDLRRSAAR